MKPKNNIPSHQINQASIIHWATVTYEIGLTSTTEFRAKDRSLEISNFWHPLRPDLEHLFRISSVCPQISDVCPTLRVSREPPLKVGKSRSAPPTLRCAPSLRGSARFSDLELRFPRTLRRWAKRPRFGPNARDPDQMLEIRPPLRQKFEISLSPYILTPCGHTFCKLCLDRMSRPTTYFKS